MKFRILIIVILTLALASCNLTLAEDVTPPPNYVPPTPMPTLVLVPERAPSVENGAAIYAEKCLPCHGETGLGDGEQGLKLSVAVKAFGLPEIARPASPEQYYTMVTRGNIERFMPPFSSLNDQERWDVVAYILTLHTTPEQIAKGRGLFEANCADCSTDFFKNQEKMSQLSAVELARLVRAGNDQVPAFGKDLSDDDLWALSAYLRTLSFDASPLTQGGPASPTQTLAASDAGTPSPEKTLEGTEQASSVGEATQVVSEDYGTISGSVDNKTGAKLPSDLTITLHGFEHATGENAGAQEVLTQDGAVNDDGTYAFDHIEIPAGRIFLVEAAYSGIALQSKLGVVESGQTSLNLAPIILLPVTEDTSALVIDELHLFFQAGADGYEILALYNFRNAGDSVIAVRMTADQREIPFLKFPKGAQGLGYEAVQDSAPLLGLDAGFAMLPNEKPYGIMAFSKVAKQETMTISQEFALPATSVSIFVPAGVEVKGAKIGAGAAQDFQGSAYQSYLAGNIRAGESLTFELSGAPKDTASTGANITTSNNNTLLIGAGILGAALVLAGVWMYARDRNRPKEREPGEEEDEEESEFESVEEILDAILALDDLHREKKISNEAYRKRREELKETLKKEIGD